jgi:hypothetical protein
MSLNQKLEPGRKTLVDMGTLKRKELAKDKRRPAK